MSKLFWGEDLTLEKDIYKTKIIVINILVFISTFKSIRNKKKELRVKRSRISLSKNEKNLSFEIEGLVFIKECLDNSNDALKGLLEFVFFSSWFLVCLGKNNQKQSLDNI